MNTNKPAVSAILILGINSIVAQIILIRELLVVFYGNEISIGIILGIWLLMGGLGGWVLGRYSDKIVKKIAVFILCELLFSLFILSSLSLIRGIKPSFGMLPGEIMPLSLMIKASFGILSPICILLGFLFTLGCHILKTYKDEAVKQVGYVYALEATGAATGGLLCNLFLIKIFSSFNILLLLFVINLFVILRLLKFSEISPRLVSLLKKVIPAILIIVLFSKIIGSLDAFDNSTKQLEWKNFRTLENKNSIYGNLNVTKQGNLYSFFSNGILMFTVPDELAQEENTHFAMLQRPDAEKILLIGGGVSGALEEVLKYPVRSIDYVELDPLIIKLARKHLRLAEPLLLDELRVKTIYADGRYFINKLQNKYDVIILNLPDPFTAQLNRFYTLEFFKMIKKCLKPHGVFSLGLNSSENYVSRELEMFLSSIYLTLKNVFTDVRAIPGGTAYFIASPMPSSLTLDDKELANRLKQKNIQTKFVRDYYLFSKLSKERVSYLAERLKNASTVSINRDFSPISYYYDMVLWSTYFKGSEKSIFKYVNKKIIYAVAAIIYVMILGLGFFGSRPAKQKRAVLTAIATTGFSEIGFEIIVIIAFQVLYGYLYYKLGIIITSFMVGLGIGGFLITKRMELIKNPYLEFIKIQSTVCLYPLLLPVVFFILGKATLKNIGPNVVFTFLPVIAGVVGGLQFPLANRIYLEKKELLGRVAGLNYGADMIGSCIGAFIISTFIIPIIGINIACLLIALLNIASLILLILCLHIK